MDNKSGEGQWPLANSGNGQKWPTCLHRKKSWVWNELTDDQLFDRLTEQMNGKMNWHTKNESTQTKRNEMEWNEICKQNIQSSVCPNHLNIWNDEMNFMLLLCVGFLWFSLVQFDVILDIGKALARDIICADCRDIVTLKERRSFGYDSIQFHLM